jgi:hypothetical protein
MSQKILLFLKEELVMNDREIRKYHMFLEVGHFATANAALFKTLPLAEELFANVSSIVNQLSEHAVAQESGKSSARKGTSVKAILRDELRQDLKAISRTARAMAIKIGSIEEKFRVPRSENDRLLINSARAFAADAAPFAAEFVKYGLAENFLEELNRDIELFENAFKEKIAGKEARVSATAGIDEAINQGVDAVRQLDAIVKNRFSNEPTKLAAWESAMVTGREPKPKVIEEDPQPTTT